MRVRVKRIPIAAVVAVVVAVVAPNPVAAQDEQIPGVTLRLNYESVYLPALAVAPFGGSFGGEGVAPQVEAIIGRDLRNSDHFEVLDSLPAGLVGDGADYAIWDRLGAVWLVTGRVEGAGDGYVLIVELHDVVYEEVRESARFRIPAPGDDDFRMAVHRTSDDIVFWATGEPGMAASRITFTMKDGNGNDDVYVIDADGENLRRVTDHGSQIVGPTWSPDATRIAFTSWKSGYPRIYEIDADGGGERMIPAVVGDGDYITPTYHPDGRTIAFSVLGSNEQGGLYSYDMERGCCLAYLSGGPWYDLSPTYSPDGLWLSFNTLRFGTSSPQVMLMPAEGGAAQTLSPYEYGGGGYFAGPEWSPRASRVAFHGRVDRRGRYHILVADVERDGRVLSQLTFEGNNEDPTWAPDGRHLAFVGVRSWGHGLFIVDVTTGRLRPIISGRKIEVPDWSPTIRAR